MGKTTINITEFEDKVSQNGKKYSRFNTDDGWMSCFDAPTIKQLKESNGSATVEVSESGGYKNIRKVYIGVPVETPGSIPERKVNDFRERQEESKQAGVSMRYAVDLCIAGKIELGDIQGAAKTILEDRGRSMRSLPYDDRMLYHPPIIFKTNPLNYIKIGY